jgi:hypothetical protein
MGWFASIKYWNDRGKETTPALTRHPSLKRRGAFLYHFFTLAWY